MTLTSGLYDFQNLGMPSDKPITGGQPPQPCADTQGSLRVSVRLIFFEFMTLACEVGDKGRIATLLN